MTIKVTIEFKSVDEAIVALGKLVAAPDRSAEKARLVPISEAAASTPSTRKPRNDAGKPRGPYKNTPPAGATDIASEKAGNGQTVGVTESRSGDPAASSTVPQDAPTGTAASAPATAGAATPTAGGVPATHEQALEATKALAEAKGIDAVRSALSHFGVNRVGLLKPEQRAEYVEHTKKAIAGETA